LSGTRQAASDVDAGANWRLSPNGDPERTATERIAVSSMPGSAQQMNPVNQPVRAALPAAPLRPYISHYWLSLDNRDERYSITPDGTVDVVIMVGASASRLDAYGTSTKRSDAQLEAGGHYLGIHFRPGQSRHFLDAKTSELTDSVQAAAEAFQPELSGVVESMHLESPFVRLDAALMQHLKRRPPTDSRIDDVIRYIETRQGQPRVSELATMYCKSRRQFERAFLDVAGVPARLFVQIIRFRRALALLANANLTLAEIAAVTGYTDQSHLTRQFVRFLGQSPGKAREHAAFVQDLGDFAQHNADSPRIRHGVSR
jgi:AraC-like DNA-binding protein